MAVFGLGAAIVLLVGGAVAYRALQARGPETAIAPDIRPDRVEAIAAPLSLTPDPSSDPAREERLRQFREAVASASRVSNEPRGAPAMAPPEPQAPPTPATAPAAPASLSGVHVVVYTTAWCPVCKRAKAWMVSHGVAYEERDIETSSDNARKVHAINPRGSIPTFDIEGDVMVGFSEEALGATMQRAAQRQSGRRQL